jgi:hypothetical protein
MAKITVYHFKCFDIKTGQYHTPPQMTTLDKIPTLHTSCEPIMETAKEINDSMLDQEGFYTPSTPEAKA